ncbi:MAG: hypothetical protein AAFN65_10265, partial [Bacteroidota bacterium]
SFHHPNAHLEPRERKDHFIDKSDLLGQVYFERNDSGEITGFVSTIGERLRNVVFDKLVE